jgi:hydroxyacylglutathione hydrolase
VGRSWRGTDRVRTGGLLAGGWTSWNAERQPLVALERVAVADIGAYLGSTPPAQVLDVREVAEHKAGAIAGSVNVPWHDIDGIPPGIDPTQTVLVICASGQRAGTAASLLQHYGAAHVIHVIGGGVPKWLELEALLSGFEEPRASALA